MKTPHTHAALIKAWADGATIQISMDGGGGVPVWYDLISPCWSAAVDRYRIKPEPKPDIVVYRKVQMDGAHVINSNAKHYNVEYIFDGTTRELKSVRMLP